ncbi:hypothetical protein [Bacillus thuringiensis]|uniref:hypothetical protein n=1 Tax=Bacillus thuringiensis TaxID=1428 RepID=UPI000CD92D12|nr:hypothetical protein [Bacillus thuringiensis]
MKVVSKTKKSEAIHEMKKTGYIVTILCDIAGVTRSGYDKWIKRHTKPSKKQSEDIEIKKKILKCHKK